MSDDKTEAPNVTRLPTAATRKVQNPYRTAKEARRADPWPKERQFWQRVSDRQDEERQEKILFKTLSQTAEVQLIHAILATVPFMQLCQMVAIAEERLLDNRAPATSDAFRFLALMVEQRAAEIDANRTKD